MSEPRKPRRAELKPSVWSPRPIPQPTPERRTADPKTPTLNELAARERQRVSVIAKADATRVAPTRSAGPRSPAPAVAEAPLRPTSRIYNTREPVATALDRDPLGRDRLTQDECRRLGDLCRQSDCAKVQLYRGNGTTMANRLRSDVLRVSQGRSVTLGTRIFLADEDRNNFAVLAHEVQHTVQYQRWGAVAYYNRGVRERISEMFGDDPYSYRVDGRRFEQYGMEQQGQIVQDYVRGFPGARSIPGVPKVGP